MLLLAYCFFTGEFTCYFWLIVSSLLLSHVTSSLLFFRCCSHMVLLAYCFFASVFYPMLSVAYCFCTGVCFHMLRLAYCFFTGLTCYVIAFRLICSPTSLVIVSDCFISRGRAATSSTSLSRHWLFRQIASPRDI